MEIPLALIDTKDGAGTAPPGPDSLLHLGMAVNDNDEETSRQSSNAYLRTARQTESPISARRMPGTSASNWSRGGPSGEFGAPSRVPRSDEMTGPTSASPRAFAGSSR